MTNQNMLLYCLWCMWLLSAVMAVMYRTIERTEQYYKNIINTLLQHIDIDKLDLGFKESALGM